MVLCSERYNSKYIPAMECNMKEIFTTVSYALFEITYVLPCQVAAIRSAFAVHLQYLCSAFAVTMLLSQWLCNSYAMAMQSFANSRTANALQSHRLCCAYAHSHCKSTAIAVRIIFGVTTRCIRNLICSKSLHKDLFFTKWHSQWLRSAYAFWCDWGISNDVRRIATMYNDAQRSSSRTNTN